MHIEEIYSEKPAFTPKHLKLTFETKEDIKIMKDVLMRAKSTSSFASNAHEMAHNMLKELDKL